jgi:Tfp pilus assembly protein PilV
VKPGVSPFAERTRPGTRSQLRRRARAFTLVEVAVTVFVLALTITTSITTLQRAFSTLDTARNISIATVILQSEMEKERLFDWPSLINTNYQPTLDATYLRSPTTAGRFNLSRTVANVSGRTTQIQVTLTVRWTGYDGRPLSRSFTTYFTQGGLNDFF